jgi:Glycosyl transferase family 2
MNIDVLSVMHNEERMLPYFLKHYSTFANRIFLWDDASTDASYDIADAHPKVILRPFGDTTGRCNDQRMSDVYTQAVREDCRGKADWVFVVDIDEIVYHPTMVAQLQALRDRGVTAVRPRSYHMVWPTFPFTTGQIYDQVTTGHETGRFRKVCVVNPAYDYEWTLGRHELVNAPPVHTHGDLKLLHYKYMGPDYFLQRSRMMFERRSDYYGPKRREWHERRGLLKFAPGATSPVL